MFTIATSISQILLFYCTLNYYNLTKRIEYGIWALYMCVCVCVGGGVGVHTGGGGVGVHVCTHARTHACVFGCECLSIWILLPKLTPMDNGMFRMEEEDRGFPSKRKQSFII